MSQVDSKTRLRTNPTSLLTPDYLAVEVDLAVLFKELTKLVGFCGNIERQLREYRLSELEQDLEEQESI